MSMTTQLNEEQMVTLPEPAHVLELEGDEFEAACGEPLEQTLNLDTWRPGENLAETYQRLEREIVEAVDQGKRLRQRIRSELFPLVFNRSTAPSEAGLYKVDLKTLERVHKGILFNGGVEACDGTIRVHDSLPVTITQIGISLVTYRGDSGTWVHRLYRRDLRVKGLDPVTEAVALLEKRRRRDSTDADSKRDRLSDFTRRGIMAYAERAILASKSQAIWRLGHGNPIPFELLTGGGLVEGGEMPLLVKSLEVWDKLLVKNRKWIYVPSAPSDRVLLTLADALYPLEYALVDTPTRVLTNIVEGELPRTLRKRAREFIDSIAPHIVIGLYRASRTAPAYMFYAHEDYAHQAAHIVMADSVLQEHRGFPLLIDLADAVCRTTFGADSFDSAIRQAYVEAHAPMQYLSERQTRTQ